MPYEPKEFGTVSVCGANTEMLIFLRGRCEDYTHYTDSVGKCTGAVTDDGCDTTSPDMNHWLEAAQSYTIVQCGAGKGEVHDFSGPACKGMEECMKYAQEQEKQAKMDKMEADGEDDHAGRGGLGHDRQREGQDPGQGGHPARPAAADLRGQAARGRPHPGRLQHPEGVHAAPGAAPARRREEAQEEDLHQAQEDQTHLQVCQAQGAPVLRRGRLGQGGAQEEGVPRGELRARRLHGRPLRPPLLRPLRPHLRLREVGPLRSLRPGDASPLRAPLASEGFSNSNHM